MTNARIIVGAAIAATSGLAVRNAVQWRDDFYSTRFGAGRELDAQTQNKKAPKPRFEVHEREIGRREFRATLMERSNNGKLNEVETIRVGMFGKLLDQRTNPVVEETTA